MKAFKKIIKNLLSSSPKNAFYAMVKCSDCGEEVKVRINHSADFQIEYNAQNPQHAFTVKKEIIGKDCFNLMGLTLALARDARLLFSDCKACRFVKFERE